LKKEAEEKAKRDEQEAKEQKSTTEQVSCIAE